MAKRPLKTKRQPAKKAKKEAAPAPEPTAQELQRCMELQEQIMQIRDQAHEQIAKEKLAAALKAVPTLFKDALLTNELIGAVTSEEDHAILNSLSDLAVEGDVVEWKIVLKFSKANDYFEETELWRKLKESSGITWKKGKSPAERNAAAGKSDEADDAAYSLFQLFEEEPLDGDEVSVLLSLLEVAADPIEAYCGPTDEEMEEIEEDEEDEEDNKDVA
ncbi:hypothetical protein DIPPA_21469 [Diplonema papillatum]|nr:hypothetical protein DIPPA_21469 [Diplonema papillatum]